MAVPQYWMVIEAHDDAPPREVSALVSKLEAGFKVSLDEVREMFGPRLLVRNFQPQPPNFDLDEGCIPVSTALLVPPMTLDDEHYIELGTGGSQAHGSLPITNPSGMTEAHNVSANLVDPSLNIPRTRNLAYRSSNEDHATPSIQPGPPPLSHPPTHSTDQLGAASSQKANKTPNKARFGLCLTKEGYLKQVEQEEQRRGRKKKNVKDLSKDS